MELIYPWLSEVVSRFEGTARPQHHALLLVGQPGIGKDALAVHLANSLLCEHPPGQRPCGACSACRWFEQGSHPDFRRVAPEADHTDDADAAETPSGRGGRGSRDIRIDQIRALSGFVEVASHRGQGKVVLITPADAMNGASANALLKTLEEPPGDTRFLLVSAQPGRLPATIRSRCQVVAIKGPSPAQALAWLTAQSGETAKAAGEALAAAGGSPRIALDLLQSDAQLRLQSTLDTLAMLPEGSALEAASGLAAVEAPHWIHALQCWTSDLIRVVAGGAPHFYPGRQRRFEQLARLGRLEELLRMEAWLRGVRRLAEHPLNARLLADDAVTRYVHALGRD